MAFGDDATPLSALFDETVPVAAKRSRRTRKVIVAAAAVVTLPFVGGTFASAITVSSGDVEFGQGSAAANACDPVVSIGINSDYSTALSYFDVVSLTLSDLDATDGTDVSGLGCMGKTLTIRAFDASGQEFDLNGAEAGQALSYLVGSDANVPVDVASVAAIDIPGDVDSALVTRVTVETT
ncbi:MAG: hypothetical protein RLZZ600_941 [Actinomycetota bacterium]